MVHVRSGLVGDRRRQNGQRSRSAGVADHVSGESVDQLVVPYLVSGRFLDDREGQSQPAQGPAIVPSGVFAP
ncbi:hypothetical protein RM705_35010, partial [Streptomyces sp. DSM 41636]|nr:hypothetical protein [Streptomyces sp. DSM 41636]